MLLPEYSMLIFTRFYSTVSPGDSINVIGDFDEEGKCDVDHQNNFLIVHPDTLVAGTKVTFSLPFMVSHCKFQSSLHLFLFSAFCWE